MDKIMFGKLLGEVYRVQRRLGNGVCPFSEGTVYGLVNGIESAVDEVMEHTGFVSNEQVNAVAKILDKYLLNQEMLNSLKGYYDVEQDLTGRGIDRPTAIKILRYFMARNEYEEVIEKFDSQHSPVECKRFNLAEYEK